MSIPYEVDPSLHTGEPLEPRLDDGFSRPEPVMATHPVEPEPLPPDAEPGGAPNPTHLPVEPELAPTIPNDAEDPHPAHPAP